MTPAPHDIPSAVAAALSRGPDLGIWRPHGMAVKGHLSGRGRAEQQWLPEPRGGWVRPLWFWGAELRRPRLCVCLPGRGRARVVLGSELSTPSWAAFLLPQGHGLTGPASVPWTGDPQDLSSSQPWLGEWCLLPGEANEPSVPWHRVSCSAIPQEMHYGASEWSCSGMEELVRG